MLLRTTSITGDGDSFYCQEDEPLAVDHDWWWPDDAEKLSKALKELGWHSCWVRDDDD
jgi:hypothetical protein